MIIFLAGSAKEDPSAGGSHILGESNLQGDALYTKGPDGSFVTFDRFVTGDPRSHRRGDPTDP